MKLNKVTKILRHKLNLSETSNPTVSNPTRLFRPHLLHFENIYPPFSLRHPFPYLPYDKAP